MTTGIIAVSRIALDRLDRLESVHARHHVIHEDHVRARLPQIFQGVLGALRGVHLQPVAFQHAAENHTGRARVVDDQGSLGHSARMIVAKVITDNAPVPFLQGAGNPGTSRGPARVCCGRLRARRGMASMAYSTADIRNIALVGRPAPARRSWLESLLHRVRRDPQPGQPRARHHRVATSIRWKRSCGIRSTPRSCTSTSAACRVNMIDTPGLSRFPRPLARRARSGGDRRDRRQRGRRHRAGHAAHDGIRARRASCAGSSSSTRSTAEDAKPSRCSPQLRETFGRECLPLNLPAGRRQARRRLLLQARRGAAPISPSVAAAHTRDRRPGRRGRRAADGALPRAGRGAVAGAAARPVRAGAARGPPGSGLLRLRAQPAPASPSCSTSSRG